MISTKKLRIFMMKWIYKKRVNHVRVCQRLLLPDIGKPSTGFGFKIVSYIFCGRRKA